MASTKETVKEFILKEFLPGEDPAALKNDTPLMTGGIIDSVGTLRLTAYLEEHFAIEIQAHEINQDNFDTIAALSQLVDSKLAGC